MATIDILMASFNCEKYIERQILSLIGQTHKEWVLYIRDDGSLDSTLQIVQKYADIDLRIKIINDEKGNLGVVNNFMELLKYSTNEYIIFCDQDDIWFENKLEILFQEIQIKNNTIPQIVYCGAYVYSLEKGITDVLTQGKVVDLQSFVFCSGGIQGSSMLFNKKLKEKLSLYTGESIMHDFTVTMIALLFGEITFVNKPLMLYRQHNNNVTGDRVNGIKQLALNFFNKNKSVLNKKAFETIRSIHYVFQHSMTQKQNNFLKEFVNFPKKNRMQMICWVIKNRISVYGRVYPNIIKIITRKIF